MRWSLFIASFVAIYALILAEVYLRLRPLLPPRGRRWALITALFLLVGPILQRLAEGWGWSLIATGLAWIAYGGMGWVLLALWVSLLSWLGQLGLWLWARLARPAWRAPSARRWALAVIAGACLLWTYGFWEAHHPVVEEITLQSPKLPALRSPLRIALVSDLHLGRMVGPRRLSQLKRLVDLYSPQVLVAAGDVLDGPPSAARDSLALLSAWQAPLGKFAVLGNHEFFGGPQAAQAYLEEAGFTVLRNQGLTVGEFLNLAGVDDPRGGLKDQEGRALDNLPQKNLTLLLKHRPQVAAASLGRFDLQLSGHTHKGQIFPFTLVVQQIYPHLAGLYHLPGGAWLYTSRGGGTWGPPLRILARPEVTIITVYKAP